MQNEIWKDIIGFEGLYQFSNLYRVKKLFNNRILKIYIDSCGYPSVNLRKNNKRGPIRIHRLTLEYFTGSYPPGMECRHLNGIKTDYKIKNLKWGTRSENMQDSIKHGTFKCNRPDNKGSKIWNAKLNEEKVLEILKLIEKDSLTQDEIACRYNVSSATICDIKKKRTWKHINTTDIIKENNK